MTALEKLLRQRPANAAGYAGWFRRVADELLNRSQLAIGGGRYRPIEVEAYESSARHPDVFAHRDPVQEHLGRWYFHKTHGAFRGGSYKGVDLAFGEPGTYSGFLFRGVETAEGRVIDGPSLVADELLRAGGYASVAALDKAIADRVAWDAGQPLQLLPAAELNRPILATARVGMSLRKHGDPEAIRFALGYFARPYRFLSQPKLTRKGRPQMVLALIGAGEADAAIIERLGVSKRAVAGYRAAYEAGGAAGEFVPPGHPVSAAGQAWLHGWLGRDG